MSIETIPVSDIMVRNVKTAEENQSINAIAKVMSENNIGSVVIVKSNEVEGLSGIVSGIITERDIVRMAGAAQTSSSTTLLQLDCTRHNEQASRYHKCRKFYTRCNSKHEIE